MLRPAAEVAKELLSHVPGDEALFERALTHGSRQGETSYQRLEFLGDRVLGILMAEWLYHRFPDEAEGKMNRRYSGLVSRETCAEVGRAIDLPRHIRLSRQAREGRAETSDNVIGDVVEALLGALYLDAGLDACRDFVRTHWGEFLDEQRKAPIHPKNGLQELAAARRIGVPRYEMVGKSGPHHAPVFRVRVTLSGGREAEAEGASKQEAETAAAAALLEQLK
ncbi:ribonuclease III [Sphingomicrobium lutaoense]|uniref:Ribonuclease 3 n=1 Tax=Sphingomicrobium lutaoense TaxID=515949 RepID=A0A839YXY0_9SPHN|nr:ribonuclease III [Sphingomicrobium lutaoense]MBB3764029.1 ribonuclease-3 [Sphingomicrobium lutaoense]